MRFLFVSDFVENRNSGAAGTLVAIAEALQRRGHQVDSLWSDPRPSPLRHPRLEALFALPRRQHEQVRRQLGRARYDVVIISQPYSFSVYESLSARYPGTLFLNRTHGWEHRFLEASHEFRWDEAKEGALRRAAAWAAERLTQSYCRRTALACDGLICASTLCAEFIRGRYGVPRERLLVAHHGIDSDYAEAPKREAPTAAPLRLLYTGNYLPLKGATAMESILPEIARRHAGLTATFVVQPEAVERVRRHFAPAFGERLAVHGWMPRGKLLEEYLRHDVFLFPSLFEGFGKSFLEAMACGLCVVGFAQGGLPDVAKHGHTALHCPTGDTSQLLSLVDWCVCNPTLARQIGAQAQAVAKEHTWDANVTRTEHFCESIRQRVSEGRKRCA